MKQQSVNYYKCKLVREKEIVYNTSSPADVLKAMKAEEEAEEVLILFCLSSTCDVVGVHEVSRGTINASLVSIREIMKRALLNNAASIIIAHNHPSGSLNPSQADIESTRKLKEAAALLGMPLLDHIIISHNGYFSFNEHGIL